MRRHSGQVFECAQEVEGAQFRRAGKINERQLAIELPLDHPDRSRHTRNRSGRRCRG